MTSDTTRQLAAMLAEARRAGTTVDPPAGLVPATHDEALAAQAAAIGLLGGPIGGWKVSIDAEGTAVPAPMLGREMHASGRVPTGAFPSKWLLEVEIAFRLKRDLAPRAAGYSRAEVIDAIDTALVGIEVVSTRLVQGSKGPFRAFIVDCMANAGYVLGDEVRDWRRLDLPNLRCTVEIDGREVHDARGGHGQKDPLYPLVHYASRQTDRLGGFKAGQVITTGSLLTPVQVASGSRIKGTVEGIGTVAI